MEVTWAQALSAIGTTAAVILALFSNVVRSFWNRPKLRLGLDDRRSARPGYDEADAIRCFWGRWNRVSIAGRPLVRSRQPECWIALTVTNLGRRDTADEVEVFVESLAPAPADAFRRHQKDARRAPTAAGRGPNQAKAYEALPRKPAWSLKWRDTNRYAVDIPSRISRRVDLAVVIPDAEREPGLHIIMVKSLADIANPRPARLGSAYLDGTGLYEIQLAVSAKNTPAARYRVTVGGPDAPPASRPTPEVLRRLLRIDPPVAVLGVSRRLARRLAGEERMIRRLSAPST
nr:hypothetical protein [uncultured Actinoplanes sp.]